MTWKKLGDLLGFVLALAALVFGVLHLREIRKTTQDLADVRRSLSTQYAGAFPDFIDKVIQTVDAAQHEVVVLCDFPAYADFSDRGRALRLRNAVEQRLQAGVKVRLICLNSDRRLTALREQFRQADFDNASPTLKEQMKQYADRPKGRKMAYGEFLEALNASNEMALKQTYRRAEVTQVDADMPIFFWIADGRTGVMAVQTAGGENEYGFKTADAALINALLATCNRYRQPQGVAR